MLMPLVDIHTIGAGGGSLAWLEAGGLRVGPQSAGADPGPACYGRGGTQPTVTDANLFLGRLDPGYFLGGRMRARRGGGGAGALASVAGRGRARRRPSSPRACSRSSTRRWPMRCGRSPSSRGSTRATTPSSPSAAPARCTPSGSREELEIGEVIVPWSPGHLLRLGDAADRHAPRRRAELLPAARRARAATCRRATCSSSCGRGAELLAAEGIGAGDHYFARSADMRYVGQEYTVNVPLGGDVDSDEIDASFHDAHRVRYGHSTPGAPVEFVNLRLAGYGPDRGRRGAVPRAERELEPAARAAAGRLRRRALETPVLHARPAPAGRGVSRARW